MLFVFPSNHCMSWDPPVLEVAEHLTAYGNQWNNCLFCFLMCEAFAFPTTLSLSQLMNFLTFTLPVLFSIQLLEEGTSGSVGLGCWLGLNHENVLTTRPWEKVLLWFVCFVGWFFLCFVYLVGAYFFHNLLIVSSSAALTIRRCTNPDDRLFKMSNIMPVSQVKLRDAQICNSSYHVLRCMWGLWCTLEGNVWGGFWTLWAVCVERLGSSKDDNMLKNTKDAGALWTYQPDCLIPDSCP